MTVAQLFHGIPGTEISGDSHVTVSGVAIDSRKVSSGDLFVVLRGGKLNGLTFVPQALSQGASAVASEEKLSLPSHPTVYLPRARDHLGLISTRVFGNPSQKLFAIGITGTNGKTTTAHLLEAISKEAGRIPGYVGTVEYRWKDHHESAPLTTPEAPDLQKLLRRMVDDQVTDLMMECSSHGLALQRLNAIDFDVAIFTNLTFDHLDFHKTMEEYREAKWKLFSEIIHSHFKDGHFMRRLKHEKG